MSKFDKLKESLDKIRKEIVEQVVVTDDEGAIHYIKHVSEVAANIAKYIEDGSIDSHGWMMMKDDLMSAYFLVEDYLDEKFKLG